MRYFNYEMKNELPKEMQASLEKHFNNDFGVGCVITNLTDLTVEVEHIVIDKVFKEDGKEVWEHYANIMLTDKGWEVSESFIEIDDAFCNNWGEEYRQWIGTKQTAVAIYGYYKTFGAAVRNLKVKGNSENKRTVIDVYV
jgi:hypothetical protein